MVKVKVNQIIKQIIKCGRWIANPESGLRVQGKGSPPSLVPGGSTSQVVSERHEALRLATTRWRVPKSLSLIVGKMPEVCNVIIITLLKALAVLGFLGVEKGGRGKKAPRHGVWHDGHLGIDLRYEPLIGGHGDRSTGEHDRELQQVVGNKKESRSRGWWYPWCSWPWHVGLYQDQDGDRDEQIA